MDKSEIMSMLKALVASENNASKNVGENVGETPGPIPTEFPYKSDAPFRVGYKYFIRTVTYHSVGSVSSINGRWLCLENASWVADSGRFSQAIKDGTLSEVEPVGTMWINLDTVVDFFPWPHALPTSQK
jgi:hypothetical protein